MSFRFQIDRKSLKKARFISRLASKIQQELIASGLTQRQVADKIGVDRAVVNRRLRGDANLTASSIVEFAIAFDKEVEINFVDPKKRNAHNWKAAIVVQSGNKLIAKITPQNDSCKTSTRPNDDREKAALVLQ